MRASLPMYARPELDKAHTHYWSLIASGLTSRGIDAPDELSQDGIGTEFWTEPDMVLSQTCGYPFKTKLYGKVELVGTPDFGVDGCLPGYYRSHFIVRSQDALQSLSSMMTQTFAFNSDDSQSGYNVVKQHPSCEESWFEKTIATGSHRGSGLAVANGEADIAAIDAVTWRNMELYDDHTEKLAILESTPPTPGLPYITASGNDVQLIRDAVNEAILMLPEKQAKILNLRGLVLISKEAYLAVPG